MHWGGGGGGVDFIGPSVFPLTLFYGGGGEIFFYKKYFYILYIKYNRTTKETHVILGNLRFIIKYYVWNYKS